MTKPFLLTWYPETGVVFAPISTGTYSKFVTLNYSILHNAN